MASVGTSTGFILNVTKIPGVTLNETKLKKRPRCNNFTAQEKTVLFSLVDKYRDIITNKKTDRAALEEKDNAWQSITSEFNSILGYDLQNNAGSQPKALKNLKCCYDNFRKKNKNCSEITFIKQESIEIDDYENGTYSYDNTSLQDNSESRTSNDSNFFDIHEIASSTYIPTKSPTDPTKASSVIPCTISSAVPYTFSSVIPSTNSSIVLPAVSSVVPSTTSSTASKKSDVFVKKPINRLYSRSNKSKKSSNMIMKLKMRLIRKDLELKELELTTQSTLSELKIKVQKAKLEFYEKKKEMLKAHCDSCESRDNYVDQ